MKTKKAAAESGNKCENCRFFIQHYVKVPFINTDLLETDDGYCIRKRRKIVRSNWVCDDFCEPLHSPKPMTADE